MLAVIEQRPYIQNFIDFVGTFGLTEEVSVAEMDLVKANLKILLDRIDRFEQTTRIGGSAYYNK
jgi:hypothetical protein